MSKLCITDYTKEELGNIIKPSFRAKQIFEWIYKKHVKSFEDMKNLPKDLRIELEAKYHFQPLKIATVEESIDGSKKYLFSMHDGKTVESVLLPMKKEKIGKSGEVITQAKYTVCISSQVGCKIGCAFCLTGKSGFLRNLTPGEITAQVAIIKRENGIRENRRVNIVFMGMGEPLDNLTNVKKAVSIFSDPDALAISPRRQTISTSGLSSQIKKLGEMNLGVLLAISLHAVDDELRDKLMPINKAYNIKSVIDAVKAFPIDARKKVILLSGIKAKVNLIFFNPHSGSEFKRPEVKKVVDFQSYLINHGVLCTIRESKGLDISAACGQLKDRKEKNEYS